jgi:hypothetical protein
MSGAAGSPTLAGTMRRWVALACVLALAVIAAPLPRVLRFACEICPADCPMHRHHGSRSDLDRERAPVHPKCHGASASPRPSEGPPAAKLGRPACGSHASIAGMAMPQMILPAAPPAQMIPERRAGDVVRYSAHDRLADPPDTPPPILLA